MFIGHIPGAYLAARPLRNRFGQAFLISALLGGVLPDLDLFLFYFVDDRAFHHHQYLPHRPVVWAFLLLLGLGARATVNTRIGAILIGLGFGGLVHMGLDSIAGSIAWGWPFSSSAHAFVIVPATHENWILSFLNHWTFKVEIGLCVIAVLIAIQANWCAARTIKNPK